MGGRGGEGYGGGDIYMARHYLSAEAAQNLHKYKYRASDLSLVYNYVLSPLSACLVGYTPRSIS